MPHEAHGERHCALYEYILLFLVNRRADAVSPAVEPTGGSRSRLRLLARASEKF